MATELGTGKRPKAGSKYAFALEYVERFPGCATSDVCNAMSWRVHDGRRTLNELLERGLIVKEASAQFGAFESHWRPVSGE